MSYILTVLIFIIGKIAFIAYHGGTYPMTVKDTWDVLIHGLSLDLSTALYLIIVPYLLVLISIWTSRALTAAHRVYWVIASVLLTLAVVADTCVYEFWGFKLNAAVLQYLEDPQMITQSVSVLYLVTRLIALAVIIIIVYHLFSLLTPRKIRRYNMRGKIVMTIVWLAVAFPIVIGIRGGFSVSTTNIGQVYYSQTQYLNHAAVNPLFSFVSSLGHTDDECDKYNFFPEDELEAMYDRLYNTQSINTYGLLKNRKPDILVVIMESCGGIFTEIEGRTDIMPNLNALAHEGVMFSNCYANSWRTDRGVVCTLSGYPSFPNMSVMKMPEKSRTLPSIASTLSRQGYSTTFLHGGDVNFTNMRSYLVSTGYEEIISIDDYSKEDYGSAKWGVRDDITFDTLYDLVTDTLKRKTKGDPFFITFLTLSSHEPWDVPVAMFDDKVVNAFYYLDKCIGTFVERIKGTGAWDDLLIVFIPDHGIKYSGYDNSTELYYHIPMVWAGGALRKERDIDVICNQTDLAATLLGQLGLPHEEFEFSRDVLSSTYAYPFAVNMQNNGFMVKDSTGFVVYDLGAGKVVNDGARDSLLDVGKAVLQITTRNLKNR